MGTIKLKTLPLGEVCDFKGGGTPSKANKAYWTGDIPWASIKDIKGDVLNSTIDSITETAVQESSTNIAEAGSLILATRITPGRPILTNIRTAINQDLKIVTPKIEMDTKFMLYAFQSLEREIIKISSGTTVLGVRLNNLKEIEFPAPPLPEQRAIVAKLEALFSELDRSVVELEVALGKVGVYRMGVLDELTDGFKKVTVSTVIADLSQGWSPKCKRTQRTNENDWAVIKTSAIQAMAFVADQNKELPNNLEPRFQHEIENGDILITRAGPRPRVGVCCKVKTTAVKLINCDKVYRIKVQEDLITGDYFQYVLNSPKLLNALDKIKTGGSDSGLNLTQNRFKKLQIPLPSLPEQQQIVAEIESRFSVAEVLERGLRAGLLRAAGLRMGILKRAFLGALV
ncbi:restriction endonuclease subunit S [Neolewinella antarctica]|nr:restriction endonuclease subunit S [Neolewinella antarctica]